MPTRSKDCSSAGWATGQDHRSDPGDSHPALAADPRIILHDRPGAAQAVLRVGHLGIARTDPEFEIALVLNQVLGGQFTSRLNEKLREERGYTYGVRSHFDCRTGRGPFSITTSVQSDKLADALGRYPARTSGLAGRSPSHSRSLKTPAGLWSRVRRDISRRPRPVNRYANLFIHHLPPDHYRTFSDRLAQVDLLSLRATASPSDSPGLSGCRYCCRRRQRGQMAHSASLGGGGSPCRTSFEHGAAPQSDPFARRNSDTPIFVLVEKRGLTLE